MNELKPRKKDNYPELNFLIRNLKKIWIIKIY